MEFDWHDLFARSGEREAVGVVAAHVGLLTLRLGIDGRRHRATVRMIDDRWSRTRMIECRLPVHPLDPRFHVDPHLRGRMRGRPPMGRVMDRAFASRLRRRLVVFARCLAFEERLHAAGLSSTPPPASAFRTDLITRRLLEWHGADIDAVVADAPRALRSRRWSMRTSAADSWCTEEGVPLAVTTARGLPSDFPALLATFDVDLLRTRVITFAPDLRVEPRRVGGALITVRRRIPATIALALDGLRLHDVVRHPVFEDRRLVIGEVRAQDDATTIRTTDPIVPLSD